MAKGEPAILYYRIQDSRYQLPERSTNWYAHAEEEELDGISAMVSLLAASRDLLGGLSQDEWGTVYSAAIREAGGDPVLSIFEGEFVADDSGAGVVVEADPETETRHTADRLWTAWLQALAAEWPEDTERLAGWERSARGWASLEEEYDLTDVEGAAERTLLEGQ